MKEDAGCGPNDAAEEPRAPELPSAALQTRSIA